MLVLLCRGLWWFICTNPFQMTWADYAAMGRHDDENDPYHKWFIDNKYESRGKMILIGRGIIATLIYVVATIPTISIRCGTIGLLIYIVAYQLWLQTLSREEISENYFRSFSGMIESKK